jgi:hypothetical protein
MRLSEVKLILLKFDYIREAFEFYATKIPPMWLIIDKYEI